MKSRVFVARAHGKFIAVEFAQSDHAGATLPVRACRELLHHGGIKRRAVVCQNFGACRSDEVACHKHVFVRNGNAF